MDGFIKRKLWRTVTQKLRRMSPDRKVVPWKAQRHKFNGPTIGPKYLEGHEVNFSEDVLRAGENIIGLQAGSNKFASQKGMVIGGVRHINDIKCDEISEDGKITINLQMGFNSGANQSGMSFGKNRSVVDI